MRHVRLFLFAWEWAFLFPKRLFPTFVLSFCVALSDAASAVDRFPASAGQAPPFSAAFECALAPQTLFSKPIVAYRSLWRTLRQAARWWTGDEELTHLRAPYQKRLRFCLELMIVDSVLTLIVPFIGQAIYDTAARGANVQGSFLVMGAISTLLLAAEGLDPLRRYTNYHIAKVTSQYIADVRAYLLRVSLGKTPPTQESADAQRLIYLHSPAFGVRNIEVLVKLPLISIHGILSGVLLWRLDPWVSGAAVATAFALSAWSARWSSPLAHALQELRAAEADVLAAFEIRGNGSPSAPWNVMSERLTRVQEAEIRIALIGQWFSGVVDRVGTLILMTGVMLWGAWHQYWTRAPTTGQILAILSLAWHVQYKISAFFLLKKARHESESADFLLAELRLQTSG